MNNNENKEKEKKESALRRFFRIPQILKIDFDKPVSFKQQMAVMGTVLFASCFLFTVVYAVQLYSGNIVSKDEAHAAESIQTSVVKEGESGGKTPSGDKTVSYPEKERITKITSAKKDIFKNMTSVVKTQEDVYNGSLILVNKNYPCRFDGENVKLLYEDQNGSYILSDYSVGIAEESVESFNSFLWDFASIFGDTDIMIACGYRSKETQESLKNAEISRSDETTAEQWLAPPGYSEHQTGYAFDFDLNLADGGKAGINYDGEGDYSWLNNNCGEYGFILRYRKDREDITGYQYEPWHFRYVGYPHSQYIEDHDIVFEEYIAFVHKHQADNAIIMEDHNGQKWCIYYVPADSSGSTNVPVPDDREFTISGDNTVGSDDSSGGGFIVTVKLEAGDAPGDGPEINREAEMSNDTFITPEVSESDESEYSYDSDEQYYPEESDYSSDDYDSDNDDYDGDSDNDYYSDDYYSEESYYEDETYY